MPTPPQIRSWLGSVHTIFASRHPLLGGQSSCRCLCQRPPTRCSSPLQNPTAIPYRARADQKISLREHQLPRTLQGHDRRLLLGTDRKSWTPSRTTSARTQSLRYNSKAKPRSHRIGHRTLPPPFTRKGLFHDCGGAIVGPEQVAVDVERNGGQCRSQAAAWGPCPNTFLSCASPRSP